MSSHITRVIDVGRLLPDPELLAADLAPKVAAGGVIEFDQSDEHGNQHPFDAWEWLIRFHIGMRKHRAPRWAEAVTKPLWLGSVYIEHGHSAERFETVSNILAGELQAYVRNGEYLRWENGDLLTLSCCRVDPDRWEPKDARDGEEVISFRDAALGHQLADMILASEEAAPGHLQGLDEGRAL
ncbi:MAG: hypothetical protein IKE60_04950 [Reyranella sp.]|uniref:hypothetical protein n=1 Tax=Reyranella sp. TaxID=1929291 RepID=UPI0025E3505B|nr:hypothetical protein [Reyranella sp.]MBR2813972.1 hypothetical protein [Reyranella sp.]